MNKSPDSSGEISRDEMFSALFAQLVIQQANMATILLGHAPHPQTGKTVRDLESARLFIDMLEMLEVKTKGNLTKEEAGLLRQSLTTLHMAFVHAAESPAPAPASGPPQSESQPAAATPETPPASEPPTADETDSKKKFTKKY